MGTKGTKKLFVLALSVFFIITTSIVYAPQTEKFNVNFEIDDSRIASKTLYMTIQNLQDIPDNLDLKTILNSTDFDVTEVKNVKFYELKDVTFQQFHLNQTCSPYEEKLANGTVIKYGNCTSNPYYTEETKKEWIEKNLVTKIEDDLKGELSHNWEQVSIQKKVQPKDTIELKLEFDHPIVEREGGWGSQGILWLDLNNKIYVDLSDSSWWNTTYIYRREDSVEFTGGLTQYDFPYMINGSSGFDLNEGESDEYVWTIARIINGTNYVYYNNGTDYSIVNGSDNEDLPFEVELGNETSVNPTEIWDDNFTGVWHLGEGTGTVTADSTSNGYGGTLQNATWNTSGKYGYGTHHVYSDQAYVNTSHPDILGDHTIEAWVYVDDFTVETFSGIVFKQTNVQLAIGGDKFNDQKVIYYIAGVNDGWMISDTALSAHQWYYIVVSYDNLTDNQRIYINGQLDKEQTKNGTMVPSIYNVVFGCRHDSVGYNEFLDGTIDEVRISNVVRSADWINATYKFTSSFGYRELGDLVFDTGDYIAYDTVNDKYEFYIDNSVVFCINASGGFDGGC